MSRRYLIVILDKTRSEFAAGRVRVARKIERDQFFLFEFGIKIRMQNAVARSNQVAFDQRCDAGARLSRGVLGRRLASFRLPRLIEGVELAAFFRFGGAASFPG